MQAGYSFELWKYKLLFKSLIELMQGGNFLLSKVAIEAVMKSGWTVDRKISIDHYEKALKDELYILNEHIAEFLSQFGALEVTIPAYRDPKKSDCFHLDPLRAINHIYRERVETYEEHVKESLVVIGEAYSEHLTLMMSESGKVYGAYDDYLTLLGCNGFEALESLCCGKETEIITMHR